MKQKLTFMILWILICSVFAQAQTTSPPQNIVPNLTIKQWREDLQFLAQAIAKGHPDPFANVDRKLFEEAVSSLDKKIPKLKRHQIIVEMAKIMAMIKDGHSALGFTWDKNIAFRRIPLRFYLFSDGLFVQSATREYEKLLGARVVRIGKLSVDEALQRLRPIIQGENEMAFKDIVTSRISMPEVLQALGITDETEQVEFTFETESGENVKTNLKPLPNDVVVSLIPARSKSKNPLPLYLKNPKEKYWFEYLKEQRIVYVNFNSVFNKEDESIEAFFARVFKFVEENPVDKFVLDMRNNNGGDNTLIEPIIRGIIKSEKINRRGKLFTIIGRLTFSAAQNTVNEIEKHTNAIFVGEPTEAHPNHFGEAVNYILPNSKIIARISQLRWQDLDPRDNRDWVAPQISVEFSSKDYLSNQDPVFAAILNYKESKTLHDELSEIVNSSVENRCEKMKTVVHEFTLKPEHKFYYIENELDDLAYELEELKKLQEAMEVLKLNIEFNPTSARVYKRLAEIYEQNGEFPQAVENYRKSLTFEKTKNVRFWLEQKISDSNR